MSELNGIDVLNTLLAQKAPITKTRVREEIRQHCTKLPPQANGGIICETIKSKFQRII